MHDLCTIIMWHGSWAPTVGVGGWKL